MRLLTIEMPATTDDRGFPLANQAGGKRDRRVRLLAVCLVLAATVGVLAGAPASSSAAPIRECGDYAPGGGAGVYNITTRVTRCRVARRMARNFYYGHWTNVPRDSRPFRRGEYTCRNQQIGYELADLRCTASRGRVVRWQHGA
jgi:hypothetical protein